MLSDNPKTAVLAPKRRRHVDSFRCHWNDNQKLEAIKLYLLLGNVALTAATLKIPDATLRVWRRTAWWKDLEIELKAQESIVVSHKLKKIVDKSLDEIDDRITNGDYIYDMKKQALVRKPVGLRDLTTTTNILMQRNEAITKEQQQEQMGASTATIADQLKFLANEFAKMNGKSIENAEDIPYVELETETSEDAIHDEREEGLQA